MTARPGSPLLLSDRAAARLLGVSRDTLAMLRKSGRLRTVPWPGSIGYRIPLAEVERVALQGVSEPVLSGRRRPRRGDVSPAAAIRALDVAAQ